MSKFDIIIVEDKDSDLDAIKCCLRIIESECNITFKQSSYLNHNVFLTEYQKCKGSMNCDLLILDYCQGKDVHIHAGLILKNLQQAPIPTILISQSEDKLKKVKNCNYKFVLDYISKNHDTFADNLYSKVEGYFKKIIAIDYIKSNLIPSYDYAIKAFMDFFDEDVIYFLISEIINRLNLQYIEQKIEINSIKWGYSKAFVLELSIGNIKLAFKVSSDMEQIRNEYKNYSSYKALFPLDMILPDLVSVKSETLYANLTRYMVDGSKTLFDWLLSNRKQKKVSKILEKLFLGEGLITLNRSKNSSEKTFNILLKPFNSFRKVLIQKAVNEIEVLINETDFENLQIFSNDNFPNNLNINYNKENYLVMRHGDFHSKNIMIQNNDGIKIIDIAKIGYQYWCVDYCRLLVNLIIEGLDYNSKDYFDIKLIYNRVQSISTLIDNLGKASNKNHLDIKQNHLDIGFRHAINWIFNSIALISDPALENCDEKPYESNKIDLKLGLMVEFLKASYKSNSIPPNRRAIALLLAYKCLDSISDDERKPEHTTNLLRNIT